MPEIRTYWQLMRPRREQVRNRGGQRRTHHINRYPAVNIHHARRFAARQGVPLNWMVTINFGLSGVTADRASRTLQKLLAQRFAPWLRRSAANDNRLAPTYVWSLEAPYGTVSAHMLLHLPKKLAAEFQTRLLRWLERIAGTELPGRSVNIRQIYNEIGATRYVLKGIHPSWGEHLAVRPVPQGEIIGKRSGFSRNLGPTARSRSGYRPKRHRI